MISDSIIITNVQVEQHHSGFGIQSPTPRVSWRFGWRPETTPVNWQQSAYDLKIDGKIYNVRSSESVLRPWPAPSLTSRQIVNIEVRCWGLDQEDSTQEFPTTWSDPLMVEVGLLVRDDWQAFLITAPRESLAANGSLSPLVFRRAFRLPGGLISKARLYITSHGVYEAKLNGQAIGDHCMAPGWTSYKHRLHYQIFDVKQHLETNNVLAIEVAPGWFASALGWRGGRRCRYGKQLGVIAQLEVQASNGTIIVCSDQSWKCTKSYTVSSELYDGEVFDAQKQDGMIGWDKENKFNDQNWDDARVCELPDVNLISPNAPPVRVIQQVRPTNAFKSKSGKVVVDFGQNLVGRLRIKSILKQPGSVVTLRHAEVMENGELGVRPLRRARSTDEIIFSSSIIQDWSPRFTFHGFRYVQIDGWTDDPDDLLQSNLVIAEVIHTDLRRTGHFSCSHGLINKLHENAVWSMKGNFISIPTDCPQRDERLGWTGDIQVFASSAAFLYDVTGMLGHWLEDFASEQAEPGRGSIPPLVVPNAIEKEISDDEFWPVVPQAIWGDASVLVPWDLYRASADSDVLRRQYQSMVTWLDEGVARGEDDLWDEDVWQLGDWLDPYAPPDSPGEGRTDGTFVADAYLVYVSRIFAEISDVLQMTCSDGRWNRHATLKKRFQDKYITAGGLVTGDTQTALSLAIMFDLGKGKADLSAFARRLERHVRKAEFKIGTGFAGTPLICHALTKTSQSQLAYRMLQNAERPSWLYQVQMGATTMWERWDSLLPDGSINPGEMTSFNHYALGSVISWLHKCVGGLSSLLPGWKHIEVRPIPGGTVTNAITTFVSPYGIIRCNWHIERDVFKLNLEVPPNCCATVYMPGCATDGANEADKVGKLVGAGQHTFGSTYTSPDWPPLAIKAPFWDQNQPRYV